MALKTIIKTATNIIHPLIGTVIESDDEFDTYRIKASINPFEKLVDPSIDLNEEASNEVELLQKMKTLIEKNWILNGSIKSFSNDYPTYLSVLKGIFIQEPKLVRLLESELPIISDIFKCPRVKVRISNAILPPTKEHHKYFITIYLNDSKINFDIKDIFNTNNSATKYFYLDQTENNVLEIQIWKSVKKNENHIKSNRTIHLNQMRETIELRNLVFIKKAIKLGSLKIEYEIQDSENYPLAKHKIENRITNYFLDTLTDVYQMSISTNEEEMNDAPDPVIRLTDYNVFAEPNDDKMLFTLININKTDFDIYNFNRDYIPINDWINDILSLKIYKDKKLLQTVSLKLSTELNIDSNCYRILERKFDHGMKWRYKIILENSPDQQLPPDLINDLITKIFIRMYLLVLENINVVSQFNLLEWDGELPPDYQNLIRLFYSFDKYRNEFQFEKGVALITCHSKYHFNNKILQKILPLILDYNYDECMLNYYLKYSSYHIAYYLANGAKGKLPNDQVMLLIENLKLITKTDSGFSQWIENYLENDIEVLLASFFNYKCLKDVKIALEKFIIPSLKQKENYDVYDYKISNAFASLYLDQTLPIILEYLYNDKEAEDSEFIMDGSLTHPLYFSIKYVAEASIIHRNDILLIFSKCFEGWIDTSINKAFDQVNRILESETNRNKEFDDFVYSLEDGRNVVGILDSCQKVWKDLDWPKIEENLYFAVNLLEGLIDIKYYYIDALMKISNPDTILNMTTLIQILNLTHESIMSFNKLLEGKGNDCHNIPDTLDKLEKIGVQSTDRKNNKMDEIIKLFCESQRSQIQNYIGDVTPNNDNNFTSSLGYVDNILKEIYHNLDVCTPLANRNIMKWIQESLMKIYDEEIDQYYDYLTKNDIKRNNSDTRNSVKYCAGGENSNYSDALDNLSEAVPLMIEMRQNLDLELNPVILDIQQKLNYSNMSTMQLISSHLTNIWNDHQHNQNENIQVNGELRIQCFENISANSIVIKLLNIRNVRLRLDRQVANLSLQFGIYPHDFDTLTVPRVTKIYPKTSHVLFGPENDDDYQFDLSLEELKGSKLDKFLILVLFDHSSTWNHKYFRGWALIPLQNLNGHQIPKIPKLNSWDFIPVMDLQLKSLCEQNECLEMQEIVKRQKEKLSQDYLYIINKYQYQNCIHIWYIHHWIKI